MKKFANIVVGVDFSESCDRAFEEANRIANWDGANLFAIHVLDETIADHLGEGGDSARSRLTSEADMELAEHVKQLLGDRGKATPEFIIGSPFRELARCVDEHDGDLLVLGSGHDPSHVGAVASKCIRRIGCDVLLVRERQREAFRHIVVCVDFSSNSKKALDEAIRIAKQDGARLDLVHVHRPITDLLAERSYFTAIVPDLSRDVDEVALEGIHRDLDQLAAAARAEGIETRCVVERCVDFRKAIIDYLRASGADLVVMGTQGRSKLKSMILGTTAERVLNHAPCSVLAIKPRD